MPKFAVIKTGGKQYKVKEKDLQPLFLEVWNLKIDFKNVNFTYVPREQNEEADALVKEAIDIQSKLI